MRPQRTTACPQEAADVEAGRDPVVVTRSSQPLVVVRRFAAQVDHRLVNGREPRLGPHRVVQLLRLIRLPLLRVTPRVTGAVPNGDPEGGDPWMIPGRGTA